MNFNIALLSHRYGNIGHDFMAYGVEFLVRKIFKDRTSRLIHFEQHRPFDIYPRWNPFRWFNSIPTGYGNFVKRFINRPAVSSLLWKMADSGLKKIDLAIACGGPNISHHASRSAEMGLIFQHLHGAFAQSGIPVINMSIGSCYPYENIPQQIPDREDELFLRRTFQYVRATTVRDPLAQQLCRWIGQDCPLIPCPSFFSSFVFEKIISQERRSQDNFVVINFQEKGANEDWGQHVDLQAWKNTVKELTHRLGKRHKIIFVCHNEKEYALAAQFSPWLRVLPRTVEEYFRIIARAKVGLCNRIHAALPLASIGVPSVGVGTDSRLGTLETVGLPVFYVKKVTADILEHTLEDLIKRRQQEQERLRVLQEKTLEDYRKILLSVTKVA